MTTRLPAFDILVDMARNDPEGLETLRRSLTDAVIAAASSENTKRRLQGLQFRVDMERRRAGTPLAATIRISEMMCRSLADLHRSMVTLDEDQPEELIDLEAALTPQNDATASKTTAGNVIDFPKA